ncbi:MAG TPA: GNAT family N-acetyltransferase [Gaiellales bacterium]
MDDDALRRAAAANHRSWFRRLAHARGGRVERAGGVDLIVGGADGTIAFPRSSRVEPAVARIRALRLHEASCWSLRPDAVLGTRLVARGFGWGWQPHWMALDLAHLPDDPAEHKVTTRSGPIPRGVPYGDDVDPPATVHLVVRTSGRVVGHVCVNPWRGVAGIYSMGVARAHRRRGVGMALTIAAARAGLERGCTHAVLNATDEGAALYGAAGFRSLGYGQTWWYGARTEPSAEQIALAEAIGFGDTAALARLDPSPKVLAEPLPGGTSPIRLAVVTGRIASAEWILDRAPGLAQARFEPFGGTLLHLAVEWNRPDVIALALARGVDPSLTDRSFESTPLGWTEHFGLPELAALLRPPTRPS